MKTASRLFLILLCCLFLSRSALQAQQRTFRICELNAENLFDTAHDLGKEDREFLPEGNRRWTQNKLWKKLDNLSREIISLGPNRPADIIALTEVENDSVMTLLCRRALLRKAGYRYIITDSPDPRGIDVALMYQPATFKPLKTASIRIQHPKQPHFRTRDILHVAGRLQNGDTLHLFLCHLSSQRGGRSSQRHRAIECQHLRRSVDTLLCDNPRAKIIIIGDFNDTPSSASLTQHLGAIPLAGKAVKPRCASLYNLLPAHAGANVVTGTYKYQGRWQMLDQCIVSGSLLDTAGRVYTSPTDLHIWAPPFLLEEDSDDLQQTPRRTYNGYRYNGGFSDHLPIFIDLTVRF